MATLRDPLFNVDSNLSADQQTQMNAASMGSLRRGWEAGRIGNELSPLHTEELQAQIDGDQAKRLGLRGQIDALSKKQALYAPEVGRLEDIHGVGDALSYAAGQVGQGAASMVDPMAASAGLGVVGRIAGAIPHPVARGVGLAAQGAALGIPYMMSRNQLRGEFIGDAQRDDELMARTSPQALMDKAGDYSTLAAVPDSALPGMFGRQISGLSRAEGAVARGAAFGPGIKTLGGMGVEGGTEALQSEMSHQAQGQLNPDRDASGDQMDNWNNFAGGALGAGPFAGAGAYAEAGHNRVGAGVDAVKGAAGDVVDLLNQNPTVQAGVSGAKNLWDSAKDKAVGAAGSTIDLASDEEGRVSAKALVDNLKAGGQELQSRAQAALEEHQLLSMSLPADIATDDAKSRKWVDDNAPKRLALVLGKLSDMDDPQAQELGAAITAATDNASQDTALDAAAEFLLAQSPMGRASERASTLAENLGKIAGVVGPAVGRGAVATGKAAVNFGKAVFTGAKEGMRKKNEQSDTPEDFMSWRDRYYGVQGKQAADQALADADPVTTQRADLAGNYVADMAGRLNKKEPNMALLARHAAFTLADTVMRVGAKGIGQQNVKLNRLVDDLYGAFKAETPEVLTQLGSIMGPKAAPVFEYMAKEVAARAAPNAAAVHAATRDALAGQVVGLVDPGAQNALMAQGINLNTPRGREQLLGIMEDFADGVGSQRGMRKALENTFGADSVKNILALLNGATEEREGDVLLDDTDAQDVKDAEKNVAKGSGQKVYGFSKAPNLRTSSERHDMFGAMDEPDADGAMQRPQLFTKGQKLFGGADAIEKKIADVKAQLMSDPEYAKESAPGADDQHDTHHVTARSAHDVMTEAGMQPGKVMQLYRDYMRMDAKDEKRTEGERRYAHQQAGLAHKAVVDSIQKKDADGKMQKYTFKLAAGERAELRQAAGEYFKERYMVVGEQLSNQDTGSITMPEILNLHKEGTGLIDRARKADAESGEQSQTALSDANVLMFKDAKDPKKTYAIPAGKLVNWVKQARGKMTASDAEDTDGSHSNKAKDEAYLADVMEGIATLIGSGYVAGMPYKVNKFGKVESFNGGVPDSLRLATKTAGALNHGTKTRREKRGRIGNEAFQGADQEAVAKDQDLKESRETEGSIDDAHPEIGRSLTEDDTKTPLDFSKKPKDSVPDEYANQRWLSVQTGATTTSSIGPEPKGTAASSAEFRAGAITDAFINEPAKGQEMIRSRIRAAMAPEYNANKPGPGKFTVPGVAGKDQVSGGVHYIAPVAYFASAENISKNNLDLPADTISAIQGKVANLLLKGEISREEKVKIARLLFRGTETKVTAMNVDGALGKLAAGPVAQAPAKPVVVKQEAPKGDIMTKAIAKRQEYLDNPPADYTSEQARAVAGWAKTQLARVMAEKSEDVDRQDQLSDYKYALLRLQQKAASVLEGDESLKDFEGTAAPEVANAGLPKDRLTLSGGNSQGPGATVGRMGDLAGYLTSDRSAYPKALAFSAWLTGTAKRGMTRSEIMRSPLYRLAMKELASSNKTSDTLRDLISGMVDQVTSFTHAAGALNKIGKLLQVGGKTTLGEALEAIQRDKHIPAGARAIAAAVAQTAGRVPVMQVAPPGGLLGQFRPELGEIHIDPNSGKLTVWLVLHEGVHAATVRAIEENPALHRQVYALLNHVVEQDKTLLPVYGATNAMEFLAEGLANSEFQNKLRSIKPNTGVAKYLGRAAADTWAQFVDLVRSALGIAPSDTSALTQLLELAGIAMKETGGQQPTLHGFDGMSERLTIPAREIMDSIDALEKLSGNPVVAQLKQHPEFAGKTKFKHAIGLALNIAEKNPHMVSFLSQATTVDEVVGLIGWAIDQLGAYTPAAKIGGVFNHQEGNARVATQADMDAAKNYALKTLGPKIKVDFKDITGYSGEFIDAQNVIEISTTAAAGTMGTLYHEAMHVFFRDFVKGNPKMQAVFETLINDPKHLAKLTSLLDGYPAAQAQLTSGEERLAYTYQFWKAGLLQVDAKAHTWLQKLGKFFRHVLGMVRDSERALELFEAFDNGKMSEPSAAGTVIAKALSRGTNAMKVRRKLDGAVQGLAALTVPAAEILGKSVSPTARKLSTMMFTNPGEEAHGSEQTGMMNARRNVAQQYTNVSNRRFETMSEVDKAAVQKYLQSGVEPHTISVKEQREAVADIRNLLDRFHKYMTDAGMKISKIDNYYPVVWNPNLLNANHREFVTMLATKYADKMGASNPYKAAERIWRSLVNKEGVDAHLPAGREDGVLSPFFASQEQRTLPWLEAADREKYLDKNMPLTLTRYFAQGAHATEYFRRFGENGIRLEKMLAAVNTELSTASKEMVKRSEIKDEPARIKWVSRQMRDISQSVGAMEGTLGKDVSPSMRTFNSWMAVYQNIRLLPMALFSSFVDPLALVARGAPMQAAYETFVYSMREVFRGWADAFKDLPPARAKDEWRQLAEHIGASEIAMFQHHVSDEYSSTYMTPGAKKLNDKMFAFNGMEAWNRGSRIMATKWAVRFIEQHAGLPDKNHSERWLKELGLQPSQIVLDDGKLVTSPQQLAVLKGITLDDARERMAPIHDALNRWVEGAVLTPNAAQRPAWSSDPNYASAFHLKQFSYSFHQTILKRATNEFAHGNIAPLGALAMFIPTMITADIMKGLIQGGGSLPPYMASMNAGDWFVHGAQRAGLSGIGVIGMDAATDWASLGGPAFEQIVDAARDGFGSKSALNAMPLHTLYGGLAA